MFCRYSTPPLSTEDRSSSEAGGMNERKRIVKVDIVESQEWIESFCGREEEFIPESFSDSVFAHYDTMRPGCLACPVGICPEMWRACSVWGWDDCKRYQAGHNINERSGLLTSAQRFYYCCSGITEVHCYLVCSIVVVIGLLWNWSSGAGLCSEGNLNGKTDLEIDPGIVSDIFLQIIHPNFHTTMDCKLTFFLSLTLACYDPIYRPLLIVWI